MDHLRSCALSVAPVEAVSPELMVCLMHVDSLRCFPSFLSSRFASRRSHFARVSNMLADLFTGFCVPWFL